MMLLGVCLLVAPRPEAADWEIVPFAGFRWGGEVTEIDTNRTVDFDPSAVFGLTVGRYLSSESRVEGTWSRQASSLAGDGLDITLDYLHFAGVYEPHPARASTAYVLVSGGVTRFDASGAVATTHLS
ncbi:MAG TPA: hypothetical protein VD788_08975, partial [Candidatus Polarisedimenticolaceae bacterium]|nr:hypothetical protein [Candidatus Polarisedimenticolaceae bacterium]